jgi:hypothetical protein
MLTTYTLFRVMFVMNEHGVGPLNPLIQPRTEQALTFSLPPVFWHYVREHLTRHEFERYLVLKQVWTDTGRGRAWLRSALNERSLERYLHALLGSADHIAVFYEDWAFVADQERSSMLTTMAAGWYTWTWESLDRIRSLQIDLGVSYKPNNLGFQNYVNVCQARKCSLF